MWDAGCFNLPCYFQPIRKSFQILHPVNPDRSSLFFLSSTMFFSFDSSSSLSILREELSFLENHLIEKPPALLKLLLHSHYSQ